MVGSQVGSLDVCSWLQQLHTWFIAGLCCTLYRHMNCSCCLASSKPMQRFNIVNGAVRIPKHRRYRLCCPCNTSARQPEAKYHILSTGLKQLLPKPCKWTWDKHQATNKNRVAWPPHLWQVIGEQLRHNYFAVHIHTPQHSRLKLIRQLDGEVAVLPNRHAHHAICQTCHIGSKVFSTTLCTL